MCREPGGSPGDAGPDLAAWFEREGWRLCLSEIRVPRPNPTFANPRFEHARLRVLIMRLSPFGVVERSQPHLVLAHAVRAFSADACVDLAFLPGERDRNTLMKAGMPLVFGIESCRRVEEFDLVCVSVSYVLELLNLPFLFLHSSIPLPCSARDEGWPPIILGGSAALASQALHGRGEDCPVDAFFYGEGERAVPQILDVIVRTAGRPKRERLRGIAATVPSVWLPWEPGAVPKAILPIPGREDLPWRYPVLNGGEASTARLPAGFGCASFCAFCFEAFDRRPSRDLPAEDILAHARLLKQSIGASRIEITGFNVNTHRDFLKVLATLSTRFDEVGVKSQRIDVLAADPCLLDAEAALGKRSFTLGVEGVSARIRAMLHKGVSTADVDIVLRRLLDLPVREVKLFFVITGHETPQDIAEFRSFTERLAESRTRANPRLRILFSAGLLMRMPGTPFQYDRLILDEHTWAPLIGRLRSISETAGFEFRLATPYTEYVMGQVLAMGDGRLLDALRCLGQEGFCYDGEVSPSMGGRFLALAADAGVLTPKLVEEKSRTHVFPWDHVRCQYSDGFLWSRYEAVRAGVDEGYCVTVGLKKARCLGCGACEDPPRRLAHSAVRATTPVEVEAIRKAAIEKTRLPAPCAAVWVDESLAGVTPEWLQAWMMRAITTARPDLADRLLVARDVLFLSPRLQASFPGFWGRSIVAFRGLNAEEAGQLSGMEREGFRIGAPAPLPPDPAWSRLELTLFVPGDALAEPSSRLADWLRSHRVPFYLSREGDDTRIQCSPAASRRRHVLGGSYRISEAGLEARLTVGARFDAGDFLRFCGDPCLRRRIRLCVHAFSFDP
ncbi:MAG: radical SAM protein [Candidatus Eisenbacteria bacterium]|nr:radical SAM protein [Candidatus Eisenbacteria bacterium]